MAHYVALVNYTDKGIANVKDSPARLDRGRPADPVWRSSRGGCYAAAAA